MFGAEMIIQILLDKLNIDPAELKETAISLQKSVIAIQTHMSENNALLLQICEKLEIDPCLTKTKSTPPELLETPTQEQNLPLPFPPSQMVEQ